MSLGHILGPKMSLEHILGAKICHTGYVSALQISSRHIFGSSYVSQGISLLFLAGDNLRKGAALNTIQIAEELLERG